MEEGITCGERHTVEIIQSDEGPGVDMWKLHAATYAEKSDVYA
jgi:hypothetical protein